MGTYFITGIAGFIGSHLARTLGNQGHDVRGIDNLSTGQMANLSGVNLTFFGRHDITKSTGLSDLVAGSDCIFHLAADVSVPKSVEDPLGTHRTNIDGTLHVLEAAREAGVKRIVFSSSSAVYGDSNTKSVKTELMPPNPKTPYAIQKLTGEYYLRAYCNLYGMEGFSLRYFNVYGAGQSASSPYSGVIAQFINKMIRGEVPTIYGNGTNSRDFVHVDDVVQANILASRAESGVSTAEVFNIGTGQGHSLNELHTTLAHILNLDQKPIYGSPRVGDIQWSVADIGSAWLTLGYQPKVGFEEGLIKTVEGHRG